MKTHLKKKFQPVKDSIVEAFSSVLEEKPIKVLYDNTRDYLAYHIEVETDAIPEFDIYDAVMGLDMEEVEVSNMKDFLLSLLCNLPLKKVYVTHILCGNEKKFTGSLTTYTEKISLISSIKIIEVKDLPEDVCLFIISDILNADIPNFKFVIKVKV